MNNISNLHEVLGQIGPGWSYDCTVNQNEETTVWRITVELYHINDEFKADFIGYDLEVIASRALGYLEKLALPTMHALKNIVAKTPVDLYEKAEFPYHFVFSEIIRRWGTEGLEDLRKSGIIKSKKKFNDMSKMFKAAEAMSVFLSNK